jgi:hypothetical protein
MNSARLVPAISAAFDWEVSPCEYQQRRGNARLFHGLGRRQTQRRERAFRHIERYRRHYFSPRQLQDTAAGAENKLLGSVHSNGAPRRPVSFYRLSAICQATTEELVAGEVQPAVLAAVEWGSVTVRTAARHLEAEARTMAPRFYQALAEHQRSRTPEHAVRNPADDCRSPGTAGAARRGVGSALDAADRNEVHSFDATIASLEARLSVGK